MRISEKYDETIVLIKPKYPGPTPDGGHLCEEIIRYAAQKSGETKHIHLITVELETELEQKLAGLEVSRTGKKIVVKRFGECYWGTPL